ncbi:MAG: 50S ribosomal protein L17 [Acidobacteriota bacterium]
MRHGMKNRKLGRTSAHRRAMFRNQLHSFMEHERIITTLPKAKELRSIAERLVTRGRQDTVPARRWMRTWIDDRSMIKKVFEEISPRFSDRPGGYTRIIKLGPRQGDNAEMAVLEFIDYDEIAAGREPAES